MKDAQHTAKQNNEIALAMELPNLGEGMTITLHKGKPNPLEQSDCPVRNG